MAWGVLSDSLPRQSFACNAALGPYVLNANAAPFVSKSFAPFSCFPSLTCVIF